MVAQVPAWVPALYCCALYPFSRRTRGISKIFLDSEWGRSLLGSVLILPLEPDFQVHRASLCVPRRYRTIPNILSYPGKGSKPPGCLDQAIRLVMFAKPINVQGCILQGWEERKVGIMFFESHQ